MPPTTPAYTVTLPGVPDVFHIIPDSALPADELAARRRQRAEQLAASPTPEIVRGLQDILTRVDDVQDALVTLSVATRFAAPYLGPLRPVAKAVATAADILNLGNLMRTAGLVGGGNKGTLYRTLAATPNTYSARLRRTLRTGRVNPTFGELLQILQTSDELLGVGLQLGPLMGLRTDALFLALRGGSLEIPVTTLAEWATLAPTFFAANPYIRLAGLAGGFALAALDLPESYTVSLPIPRLLPLDDAGSAAYTPPQPYLESATLLATADELLTDAALLDVLEQDLSPADHAAITHARYAALAILTPFALATPTGILDQERGPNPLTTKWLDTTHRKSYRLPDTHPSITAPALPLPNAPAELTLADTPTALLRAGAPGALAWVHRDPYHPLAIHYAAHAKQALATLALALEGKDSLQAPVWSHDARAAARTVELAPPPDPV